MRKFVLLTLSMVMLSLQLLAQSRTIKGRILDEKGTPVPSATVVVTGTTTGTVTNSNGEFSMSVPANAKSLTISGVGYAEQQVRLGSDSDVSISLKTDNSTMEGVVITGYTREKKSQFAGAATTLNADKTVGTVPVGSWDQALQGRAAGVQVTSSSGQPGTSAAITIRGMHTLNGAVDAGRLQPLYVIDGVPMPAYDMASVNANDFESITVLKDASASALYGARGGQGVIVITTKKGKAGTTNVTLRTQFGVTEPPNWNKFDMMNTQEIMLYEERLGLAGFATNTPGWTYSKKNPAYATLTPATQARYDFLRDSIGKINTNYGDVLFRTGLSQTHEINVSGGTDKTRVFLSGGIFDQQGTDLTSALRRYTARFNIDHSVDKFSVMWGTTVGYSKTTWSEGEWQGNTARNSFQMAWRSKPYENPYRADGSLIFGPSTTLALKQVGNVIEGMENTVSTTNQIKINSGLTLAYRVHPNFTLKNVFGVDVGDERWQRWIRPTSYIGGLQANGGRGYNAESYRAISSLINTTSGIFAKRFGSHDVEAGAYFEVVRGWNKGLGFQVWNLDPRLELSGQGVGPLPIASTTQQGSSAKSGYGIRSYFATGRYTYNNKYTITGNVRRDGTSRIANEENQEITTWSAGAIWNAFAENFMSNQRILSDWKMRISYGAVPNIGSIATGSYGISGGLVGVTSYLAPQVPAFGGTQYAGSTIAGQAPTGPGNPNLQIETIRKLNIGTDFALWRNRARFTVDVYRDETIDMFVANNIPATAGFGSGATLNINGGTMINKGIEMAVSVDIVDQRDLDFTIGINHAINKNEITSLGLVNDIPQGTYIHRVGLSFGSHYAQHYLGADPATGRPVFETEDGKTTTDPGKAFLFAKYGTFMPKHVGGFTADFRFKNITVGALFSYQFDVTRYNNIENWVRRGITGYHASVNASRVLLTEQWQKPGDNVFYQSPAYDRGFNSSDIQDAKFLRFRNLTVAYNVPELTIGSTRIMKSARFYIMGQNLAIWSPWRGPDPEDSNNISLNEFPNPRMFVAGIDITF